jgi:MFS family permease
MNNLKLNMYAVFRLLLFAGFISGGAVMSAELISAKIIAAYFGNSLYVWSSVLAITLGGLASGYFAGGYLSLKQNRRMILLITLISVSILMFCMPFISATIMKSTLQTSLKAGILVSCLVFVFPPLFCFGMVSPLIIGIIEQKINDPGRISGIVYSISTLGGILFTFITGYFLIPYFGLKETAYLMGLLLGIAFLLALSGSKKI